MASSLTDQDPAALDVDSGTAKVITEVLRRETLLKTGTWQNALVSSADFSIIATDAKGLIQLFNVGAERMLGYAAAEVVNEITPANFSDPQEMVARAEALSLELATPIAPGFEALVCKASRGIEDIYELTYILKDGSRFPALVSVTALYDAHSAVVGYLLIGTDNTARKKFDGESQKLARRLRAQQVHTRSLIESHSDALMTTDPSGIITDANEPMEALTGCTRAELIGAAFKSCFTDPERADTAIQEVLRENKVTDYVLTVRARDGKTTMVSYSASTFHGRDGALLGVLATVRDVTECERSAQTLPEASDELERARAVAETTARAQSDFLSSMSAELRVSLKQILGVAQLLASGSPRPAPSRNKGIVQILRAGRYLLNLINEVFDPATVEAGRLSLSLEPVSLVEVMRQCQALIEPQAQERGVSITFPRLDLPCFVRADRIRVKQILLNLLSNAVKHSRQQGTVEVTCTESVPGRVRIGVKDAGPGLLPERLAQLLQTSDPLEHAGSSEEGSGIGLVLTSRLAELMGGAIGAESTVGLGSTFWVELDSDTAPHPATYGPEPAAVPELRVPGAGRAPRTLLYVEDDPADLELVAALIARRPDVRLLSAQDGNLGMALARVVQPDVILMDIHLPGISGIEALKMLREDPATAHIPVIAISVNTVSRDIAKGLEAGFFRCLTKPFRLGEFMETLDLALAYADIGPAHGNGSGDGVDAHA